MGAVGEVGDAEVQDQDTVGDTALGVETAYVIGQGQGQEQGQEGGGGEDMMEAEVGEGEGEEGDMAIGETEAMQEDVVDAGGSELVAETEQVEAVADTAATTATAAGEIESTDALDGNAGQDATADIHGSGEGAGPAE
eukprot:TRINITY_DN8870_c0_g1_i2.p3 TRINITY_DN8870_c0_g1~~TRINITY_DN8870_c0_g1_i2.p3  ORF type:complete len:138 (-),score=53.55 TRINITY_DN8870_c0_g1_i2:132-545(-)